MDILNDKNEETVLKYEIKFNFGVCKICSDKATGIHYGITTCEGCKGFFKRSIPIHKRYVCPHDKKCKIQPKQRKKCKYCRWNLCVQSGMSFDSIRVGRIPNRMKEKHLIKFKPGELDKNYVKNDKMFFLSIKYLLKLNNLTFFETIKTNDLMPNSLFVDYCLNTSKENNLVLIATMRDKCHQLFIEHTREFDNHISMANELKNQNKICYDDHEMILKKDLAFLKTHAKSMKKLINDMPGFKDLKTKDLDMILNQHFFSVLGIRTLKLFVNDDYYLVLDKEVVLGKQGLDIVLGKKVREKIFDFHFKLNSLNLSEKELALLIACLFSSECPTISQTDEIKKLNQYYSQALIYEFNLNNRKKEFLEKFFQLIVNSIEINKICKEVSFNI